MRGRFLLVLVAASLILFITVGTRQSFGLYLAPMSKELGWGREVFSFAIALQNVFWGLSQPFIGAIADRYGSGRVLAAGGAAYALGLYVMAGAATDIELHLGAGLLIGVALSATGFAIVFSAVAKVAPPERQGLALGIAGAVGSAGQFVVVLGSQVLLDDHGWRNALMVAIVGALIVVALAYPARDPNWPSAAPSSGSSQTSFSGALGEAFGHGGYWLLNAGFFVCGFHVTFIMTHLPAAITDGGLPGWVAGTALAMVGAFNIVGSFACGVLGDRYRKKYILSLLYLARAGIIAVFLVVPMSAASVIVFGAAMGLLWLGTVPLTSGLVAQIFGVRYMATLFGIVFFSHQLGGFLGVWLGGRLYDATGSYDVVWIIAIALGVLAAVLHWPIRDRPLARLSGQTT